MQVEFVSMAPVEQDRIYVRYENGVRKLVGYMGLQPHDAFLGILQFVELGEDDRNHILELIWQQKGKRKAVLPKIPPRSWQQGRPYGDSGHDGTPRLILP